MALKNYRVLSMANSSRLIIAPHPLLSTDVRVLETQPGQKLGQILTNHDLMHDTVHALINGRRCLDMNYRPVSGENILICQSLAGGDDSDDGKGVFRVVASIAIAVAAIAVAGPLAASMGLGAAGTSILAAGLSMVGQMALTALIPPPAMAFDRGQSLTYSFNGQSNQTNPWGIIARIFGRVRVYPALAVDPLIEHVGTQSWITMLFDFGVGDIDITEMTIDQTNPYDYTTDIVLHKNTKTPQLRWAKESINYQSLSITPRDGVPEVVSVPKGTKTAVVSLTFPEGIRSPYDTPIFYIQQKDANGAYQDLPPLMTIGVPWRQFGGNQVEFKYTNKYDLNIVAPISFTFSDPDAANSVRFIRSYNGGALVTIALVKSYKSSQLMTFSEPHTLIEMRIPANDQISGIVRNFSAIATSILPSYISGVKQTAAKTRNPAWICVEILTGSSNPRPLRIDQLDMAAWERLAAECDKQTTTEMAGHPVTVADQFSCDLLVNYETTVQQIVNSILSQCRATLKISSSGLYSVLIDRVQSIDAQIITTANSWDFAGNKAFADTPHGLNVKFVNEQLGYELDVCTVYSDNYSKENATKFEDLETVGVTDYAAAWRFGRYMLAQGIQRAESFSVTMDLEYLAASRGDRVAVMHDVMSHNGIAARVTNIDIAANMLTLDTDINADAMQSPYAMIRQKNGTIVTRPLTTPSSVPVPVTAVLSMDMAYRVPISLDITKDSPYGTLLLSFPAGIDAAGAMILVEATNNAGGWEAPPPKMKITGAAWVWFAGRYINFSQHAGAVVAEIKVDYADPSLSNKIRISRLDSHAAVSKVVGLRSVQVPPKIVRKPNQTMIGAKVVTSPVVPPVTKAVSYDTPEGAVIDLTAEPNAISATVLFEFTSGINAVAGSDPMFEISASDGAGGWESPPSTFRVTGTSTKIAFVKYVIFFTPINVADPSAKIIARLTVTFTDQTAQNHIKIERQPAGAHAIIDPIKITSIISTFPQPGPVVSATGGVAGISIGDLLVVAESTTVGHSYLIQKIEPGADLSAKLTLVRYDPGVYDAAEGLIPGFEAGIGPDYTLPILIVENLAAGKTTYAHFEREPVAEVHLTWTLKGLTSDLSHYDIYAQVQGAQPKLVGTTEQNQTSLALNLYKNPELVGDVVFLVSPVSVRNKTGIAAALTVTVLADDSPPAPVQGFTVSMQSGSAELFWFINQADDVYRYELRYSPDETATADDFGTGQALATVDYKTNRVSVGARLGTYFIRALDISGNASTVVHSRSTVQSLPGLLEVKIIDDTKTGLKGVASAEVTQFGSELHVTGDGFYTFESVYQLDNIYEVRIVDKSSARLVDIATGETDSTPGAWSMTTEYSASDRADVMSDWVTLSSKTPNLIGAGLNYTPWRRFDVADVTGHIFKFRTTFTLRSSFISTHKIIVRSLAVEIDALEVIQLYDNKTWIHGQGIQTYKFTQDFIKPPLINVVIQYALNPGGGSHMNPTPPISSSVTAKKDGADIALSSPVSFGDVKFAMTVIGYGKKRIQSI